jgi:hypothetical protein
MMPANALLAILASMLAAMLAVEAVAAVGDADLQLLWSVSVRYDFGSICDTGNTRCI